MKVARPRVAETRALLDVRDPGGVNSGRAVFTDLHDRGSRADPRATEPCLYRVLRQVRGPINRFTLKERHPSASVIEKAVEASEREWRKALPEWMESSQRQAETPSEELRAEWEQSAIDDLTVVPEAAATFDAAADRPGSGVDAGARDL